MNHDALATTGWGSVGSPGAFIAFFVVILTMLAIDLGVFRGKQAEPTMAKAGLFTALWVGLAAAFGIGIGWRAGNWNISWEFAAGYVVEEALSVDNVFVFSVILRFFAVPKAQQHRVLFWGILGALILRGVFIGAGAAILHTWHGVIYIFGAILIYTGVKLLSHNDDDVDPDKSLLVRVGRWLFPVTSGYRGDAFFVVEQGKRFATPLFIVLLAIEGTDVLFAVDSIPAVFGVTKDPFIVYTSNIFAILGLRSLYFLVAGMMDKFAYLKYGLSIILMFVGGKMLISGYYEFPILASLGIIVGILAVSIAISLAKAPKTSAEPKTPEEPESSEPPV